MLHVYNCITQYFIRIAYIFCNEKNPKSKVYSLQLQLNCRRSKMAETDEIRAAVSFHYQIRRYVDFDVNFHLLKNLQ